MTTQTKQKEIRVLIPKLMFNISVLYQNNEITAEEKNQLCMLAREALKSNDLGPLNKKFKTLRCGASLLDIIEECVQITN